MEDLNRILDWILESNQQERDEHPFIIPIRRKMAPIAAIKTRWVMKNLASKRVFVSPCSLKEGGLYNIASIS
jgi:exopolyphosphatase/guanosine-5'-triphosphate,3'-diphosphate pyrophosphatase